MKRVCLFVGNGINNMTPGISWKNILVELIENHNLIDKVKYDENKPLPLLYEEIYLNLHAREDFSEERMKEFVAEKIRQIGSNPYHDRVRALGVKNIITTNYDYALEGNQDLPSASKINETKYSIFRKKELDGTNYWHIHGEANVPASINLGFEHYSGQLQQMRNYVTTGTSYKTMSKSEQDSLVRRIKRKGGIDYRSWVDLFFTDDIHIFGLGLKFMEIDLWWLLTFWGRQKFNKRSDGISINNKIVYYTHKSDEWDICKFDLLKANGVQVVSIDTKKPDGRPDWDSFYDTVINKISNAMEDI